MYKVPWWWSIWIETCRQTYKVPYKIKSVYLLVIKVIITKMHGTTHIKAKNDERNSNIAKMAKLRTMPWRHEGEEVHLHAIIISVLAGGATRYQLDGPGIDSRWGGEIFRARPDRPWSPPSLLYNGYQFPLPRVEQPGRGVNHSPPSSAEDKKQ